MTLSRRTVTICAAAALSVAVALTTMACSGRGGSAEDAPRPPNLLFVLIDDLRWDDIGAAGHPFVETPNIDRLAQEGARFLNAFATTPLCSPSARAF
jgi:N-acetylglucosamine-6-sulfatase